MNVHSSVLLLAAYVGSACCNTTTISGFDENRIDPRVIILCALTSSIIAGAAIYALCALAVPRTIQYCRTRYRATRSTAL